jgi:monoamine oxidase
LREVVTDFSADRSAAIASVKYEMAGKIGLQFGRRFWEEDDRIFGGASSTDMTITQIMYPSTGMLQKKGVLVGYYVFRTQALELQAMRHPQRLETAPPRREDSPLPPAAGERLLVAWGMPCSTAPGRPGVRRARPPSTRGSASPRAGFTRRRCLQHRPAGWRSHRNGTAVLVIHARAPGGVHQEPRR